MHAINRLTKNLEKWEDQGWLFSKHTNLFKDITTWTRFRSNQTKMIWVKGHSRVKGNEEANKLAAEGSKFDLPPDPPIPTAPTNMIPSGDRLPTIPALRNPPLAFLSTSLLFLQPSTTRYLPANPSSLRRNPTDFAIPLRYFVHFA